MFFIDHLDKNLQMSVVKPTLSDTDVMWRLLSIFFALLGPDSPQGQCLHCVGLLKTSGVLRLVHDIM